MNKIKLFILLVITSIILISCKTNKVEAYSETGFALGTVCSITLYEKNSDFNFSEAFAIINAIENRMSTVITSSEIYDINSKASVKPVRVSEDTFFVIQEGIKYANRAESKFDITIGPLVNLWGIGTDRQHVPDHNVIQNILPLIDSNSIILDNKNMSVFLENRNMSIDLGGIAKGYAADRVKNFLIERGFTKGIINLGGNVLTFGLKRPGVLWKIGIQDPVDIRGNYIGTLEIEESAVVTSGIMSAILNPEE